MNIKRIIALAAVAGALCSGAAMADSVKVQHADLNLSSPADAKILYRRIVSAADLVCPENGSASPLLEKREHDKAKACRSAAIADAVASVQNPTLAAVHASYVRNLVAGN